MRQIFRHYCYGIFFLLLEFLKKVNLYKFSRNYQTWWVLFSKLPLIDTTEHVQNVLRYFNLSFNNSVCYNCFLLCRMTLQRQILSTIISSSLIMSSYKRPISWFKNYKLNGWKIFQFWHECVMLSRTDLRDTEMDV